MHDINVENVLAFYNAALNDKNFDRASTYLHTSYKQHNPNLGDGHDGLKTFIERVKVEYPRLCCEIKNIFVDGDYVILHVHSMREPNTQGRAIIDIFKLQNGKISEHWDVIQDIPVTAANSNGMF